MKTLSGLLHRSEDKFELLYENCGYFLPDIEEINRGFKKSFHKEVTEVGFEEFKESYRASTTGCF